MTRATTAATLAARLHGERAGSDAGTGRTLVAIARSNTAAAIVLRRRYPGMRRITFLALLLAGGILAQAADAIPRLHAERGASPAIVTADGRQVLLRGVNVNQLGDYWQQRPDPPATLPLTESDFAGIQSLGMDVVRLIVHWSRLEPQRGRFDDAYIARIRQALPSAGEPGIYVMLGMHHNAWGHYLPSPRT